MSTLTQKAVELRKTKHEEFRTASPSRMIDLALEDLEATERNPKYKVDMSVWYVHPDTDYYPPMKTCRVCFAGAVMTNRLEGEIGVEAWPDAGRWKNHWDPETRDRLMALNHWRLGYIDLGLDQIGFGKFGETPSPELPLKVNVADYRFNPDQFKMDMRKLADDFRRAGL